MADFRIDDMARRLFETVPPALRGMQQDFSWLPPAQQYLALYQGMVEPPGA